ncbi:hypothetical protein RRF57_003804 [Xylaria bambusicola]|uniref:Uncharacterized protein n=1 Tax=Xylaria bambusicola TaxID=326684 RepID=A0AAN7UFQ3_9PEZI
MIQQEDFTSRQPSEFYDWAADDFPLPLEVLRNWTKSNHGTSKGNILSIATPHGDHHRQVITPYLRNSEAFNRTRAKRWQLGIDVITADGDCITRHNSY